VCSHRSVNARALSYEQAVKITGTGVVFGDGTRARDGGATTICRKAWGDAILVGRKKMTLRKNKKHSSVSSLTRHLLSSAVAEKAAQFFSQS